MVAIFSRDDHTNGGGLNPTLSGWTRYLAYNPDTANGMRIVVMTKTASTSEPSSYAFAAGSDWNVNRYTHGAIVTLRNAKIMRNTIGRSQTVSSISITQLPAIGIYFFSNHGSESTGGLPTGHTQIYSGTEGSLSNLHVSYQIFTSGTATGTVTYPGTWSSTTLSTGGGMVLE
jgi:hypothetical protein